MKIIENTTEFHIDEPTAVAIGKFDGFHLGHQRIFEKLLEAKKKNLKTVIFTFNPSPAAFFGGRQIPSLSTIREKKRYMERLGIDYYVEYPFYEKTAAVEPEDYVRDFLLEKLHMHRLVAGEDVSFGAKGRGDALLLKEMSNVYGFGLHIIPKRTWKGMEISSTLVRDLIGEGDMEAACELLGRPYAIFETVAQGKKLGRKIGIPTANLYPSKEKFLPPFGVYYGKAELCKPNSDRHLSFPAVINVGIRPTVNDGERVSAEGFFIGCSEEVYGWDAEFFLQHFARAEKRFDDVDRLKAAVEEDLMGAKAYFMEQM